MRVMAPPLVSVIVPAYRADAFLVPMALSLLAQTMPEWEALIVSDDGEGGCGEEACRALLQHAGIKDPRFAFYATGARAAGPSRARNLGLAHARGDLIAFLDADDRFHPQRLERLVPLARAHGMAVSAIAICDKNGKALPNMSYVPVGGSFPPSLLPYVNLHSVIPFVYDRSKADIRFAEDMRCFEDFAFAMQAASRCRSVGYDPLPLYAYVKHEGSITASADVNRKFIAACGQLEAGIAAGRFSFVDDGVRAAALRYAALMRQAEEAHLAALEKGGTPGFYEVFAGILAAAGLCTDGRWRF